MYIVLHKPPHPLATVVTKDGHPFPASASASLSEQTLIFDFVPLLKINNNSDFDVLLIRYSSRTKDFNSSNGSTGAASVLDGEEMTGCLSGGSGSVGASGCIELCEMERRMPRGTGDIREMATNICRQYIRSSTRYHLLDHLKDIGKSIVVGFQQRPHSLPINNWWVRGATVLVGYCTLRTCPLRVHFTRCALCKLLIKFTRRVPCFGRNLQANNFRTPYGSSDRYPLLTELKMYIIRLFCRWYRKWWRGKLILYFLHQTRFAGRC